jgi:hypothetical protein
LLSSWLSLACAAGSLSGVAGLSSSSESSTTYLRLRRTPPPRHLGSNLSLASTPASTERRALLEGSGFDVASCCSSLRFADRVAGRSCGGVGATALMLLAMVAGRSPVRCILFGRFCGCQCHDQSSATGRMFDLRECCRRSRRARYACKSWKAWWLLVLVSVVRERERFVVVGDIEK